MSAAWTDLRRQLRGTVTLPGDAGFAAVARPWNTAVTQPVAAVVEVADVEDAAALVRYAGSTGLTIATQPTGHGASGVAKDAILVRTGKLSGVSVQPDQRTARVGAGVSWGELQSAASPYGLTGLAGSSPVVGVVGHTLGGGLSWFSRRFGLAAHSVRSFEVVGAAGDRATVTASSDPELFWALRGGGGDFALVTAIELDLHPAPELIGGRMLWPASQAERVLAGYRALTEQAPEQLTAWLDLLQFPGAEPLVAVDTTYLGPAAEADELLGGLAAIPGLIEDGRSELPVARVGEIANEPTTPGPGITRGELLTELSDVVSELLLRDPVAPLMTVQIRHLGGALAHPSDTVIDSAAGSIAEPYALYLFGVPTSPEVGDQVRARQLELTTELAPQLGSRKPFNFLSPSERAAAAFPPATLARLREIKQRRDPAGVFRSNYPVNG